MGREHRRRRARWHGLAALAFIIRSGRDLSLQQVVALRYAVLASADIDPRHLLQRAPATGASYVLGRRLTDQRTPWASSPDT